MEAIIAGVEISMVRTTIQQRDECDRVSRSGWWDGLKA
jgi:hypothetical protein